MGNVRSKARSSRHTCSLGEAVERGHMDCYRKARIKGEEPIESRASLMHLAIEHGRIEFVYLFLREGASLDRHVHETAAIYGRLEILELLCAQVHIPDYYQLVVTTITSNEPNCLRFLLKNYPPYLPIPVEELYGYAREYVHLQPCLQVLDEIFPGRSSPFLHY